MKEFEKALRGAQPPDVPVPEFQRALRHELSRELQLRQGRRIRHALIATTAAAAVLTALLAVFVLRPSVPATLHASMFRDPGLQEGLSGPQLQQLLASADEDQAWVEAWYAGSPDSAKVLSMEEERFFALRRFQLTSGQRIIVFTEVGEQPDPEPGTALAAVRNF